jgi:hypothetical protein
MSKPKSKMKWAQLKKPSRLSRSSLLVVSAFVLVFVGLGSFYIARSEAAGHDCVKRTYSYVGARERSRTSTPCGTCPSDKRVYHSTTRASGF